MEECESVWSDLLLKWVRICMVECESVWVDSLLQWVSLRRSGKLDLVGIFQICEEK